MSVDIQLLANAMDGLGHPIRIRILVLLEREHSPSELFAMMPGSLGMIAYHMRELRKMGLVTETRTAPRRGALEHFYLRTEFASIVMDAVGPLIGIPPKPKPKRGPKSAAAADAREHALLVALGCREEEEAAA